MAAAAVLVKIPQDKQGSVKRFQSHHHRRRDLHNHPPTMTSFNDDDNISSTSSAFSARTAKRSNVSSCKKRVRNVVLCAENGSHQDFPRVD